MGQAPSLSFSPALGSHCDVAISSNASHKQSSVELLLSARLNFEEAEQLQRDGVKIQAWTDAPVEGRASGEWAAYTFEQRGSQQETVSSNAVAGDDHVTELSLVDIRDVETGPRVPSDMIGLQLKLKLRPMDDGQPEVRFAITYRLEHPGGDCTWLGAPGHDVVCVLRRENPWVEIFPAWEEGSVEEDVQVLEHRSVSSSEGLEDVYVGQITHEGGWACWAISDESVKYHCQGTQVSGANVLIFFPRLSHTTFALHEPIALWTSSPEASFTLSPTGRLSCTHATPIHISTASSDVLARSLCSSLSSLHLRSLEVPDERVCALVSTSNQAPSRLFFVSLHTETRMVDFSLDGLIDNESAGGHVLYTSSSKKFLHFPAIASQTVRVSVGPSGGECLLSPVHVCDSGSASWGISLLAPHTSLPTPEPAQPTLDPQPEILEEDKHEPVQEEEPGPELEPVPEVKPKDEPVLDPETDKSDSEPFDSESEHPPLDYHSQTSISAPASEHGEPHTHHSEEILKQPTPPPLRHIALLFMRMLVLCRILVLGRILHVVSVSQPQAQSRIVHEPDSNVANEETSLLTESKATNPTGYGSVEEKLEESTATSADSEEVKHAQDGIQTSDETKIAVEASTPAPNTLPEPEPEPETEYGLPVVIGEEEQTVLADAVVPPVARASLSFFVLQGVVSLIFLPRANTAGDHLSGKEPSGGAKTYEVELFAGEARERLDLMAEQLEDSEGALLLEVPGGVSSDGVLEVFVREIVE